MEEEEESENKVAKLQVQSALPTSWPHPRSNTILSPNAQIDPRAQDGHRTNPASRGRESKDGRRGVTSRHLVFIIVLKKGRGEVVHSSESETYCYDG
jgi:hypothetical protein